MLTGRYDVVRVKGLLHLLPAYSALELHKHVDGPTLRLGFVLTRLPRQACPALNFERTFLEPLHANPIFRDELLFSMGSWDGPNLKVMSYFDNAALFSKSGKVRA